MIPVDQTTFGHPGGNCFSACVASLLHLGIDEVPYFMSNPGDWFVRFADWLKPFGLFPLHLQVKGWDVPDVYCILGGKSPRGPHAVVGLSTRMVHDPHPSRDGLAEVEDITLLVPFSPSIQQGP
jgi:hypothetical protein